jgi:regulatory protein
MTDSAPESEPPDQQGTKAARQAYDAAIRLLAHRDHTVLELTGKLRRREHSDAAIDSTIASLVEAGYLDDARYAEHYAGQRVNQGYGPLSIRSKLAVRGVDSRIVQQTLRHLQVDWVAEAEKLIQKRFAGEDIIAGNQQTTARIVRFVQQRGFSSADTLRALQKLRRTPGRSSPA